MTVEYRQELIEKVNKYIKKYKNKKIVYVKTIFYCFTKLFGIPSLSASSFQKNNVDILPENILRIAVKLDGGLGDIVVYSLWVKEFSKIIEGQFMIDVFPHPNMVLSKAAFKENTFVNKIYKDSFFQGNVKKYDLVIAFRRFPYVVFCDVKKVEKFSSNLVALFEKYNRFLQENIKFFAGSTNDTLIDLYSICKGEKRIQQPDIDNLLKIDDDTKLYLPLTHESFKILKSYGLENSVYITLTRSVDQKYDQERNIRLWPLQYYEELISLLKQKYPHVKLVQLGVPRCEELKGIDVNLLGKTDLEEVKAILKHSLLHIDGECGMVHVKHFLYGKSAVFFGQTAIEYLGYENNINLKSGECSHWCEWIADDWQTRCIRGYEQPPCMTGLTPQYVFENITPYLDSVINKCEKELVIEEVDDINLYFIQNPLTDKRIVFYGKEFYELAKLLIENNNTVTIYDEALDNSMIREARELNITVDYGDIYNIPEDTDSIDIFVCNSFNDKINREYALKEIKRIANELIFNSII